MQTNSDVIYDALGLLGVTSEVQSVTAEQGAHALRVMNDLLTMWENNQIDVGYFEQDTLTDDSPINPEHMMAVKYNLAIALAPFYGKQPDAALAANAGKAYLNLLKQEQVSRMEPADLTSWALGGGWGRYNIETDT